MSDLNISVRQFRALVSPVLPLAADDAGIPVLSAVLIESRGKWLTATATDRFRLGVKRVKSPEGDWPEFTALMPVSTVKAILSAFKPNRRDSDPELTLSITAQDRVKVIGGAALLDMLGAEIEYPLTVGKFPPTRSLITKALADSKSPTPTIAFNFGYLSDFAKAGSNLAIRITSPGQPAVVTNGEDFIGILMPRRSPELVGSDGALILGEDWSDILAPNPSADTAEESAA